MKLTKRKGFNFFRSYYDVYNELSDKDKVAFTDALFDRQFLGEKPEGLKGMAKFAYISQTNSIDSQVKGYEDKTGIKLNSNPTDGGISPPTDGGIAPPTQQVQVQGKEEGKEEGKKRVATAPLFTEEIDNLFNSIVGEFPELTQPKTPAQVDSWKKTLVQLINIDKVDAGTIEHVIKVIRKDSFWSKNFLSVLKLRKKDKSQDILYVFKFIEIAKDSLKQSPEAREVRSQNASAEIAEILRKRKAGES